MRISRLFSEIFENSLQWFAWLTTVHNFWS